MPVTLGFAVPDLCVEPDLITVIDGTYIQRCEGCPLPGGALQLERREARESGRPRQAAAQCRQRAALN